MKTNLLVFVFIFSFLSSVYAQVSGEIFTKEKADELFGEVKESVELSLETVQSFVESTDDFIMFKIVDGSLIVANSQRKIFYNKKNLIFSDVDVFYMYSTFVFEELIFNYIDDGAESDNLISFEMREEVFSVTAGQNTMEHATPCPPFCPSHLQISKL